MTEQQCPYCLITKGQIPTNKVYEDGNFLAALEIRPANPGHVILFPKKHFKGLSDMPYELVEEFLSLTGKLANAVSAISEGVSIIHSSGEATKQPLEHPIINIIPRFSEDNLTFAWNPKQMDESQMKQLSEAISKSIPTTKKEVKEIKETEGPSYEDLEKELPKRET